MVFPFYLTNDSEWKRLVGLGARQVSFLNINVYVLGLYMKSEDIRQLQSDPKWKVGLGECSVRQLIPLS
jgi:hypothetical protein